MNMFMCEWECVKVVIVSVSVCKFVMKLMWFCDDDE